MGAWMKSTQRVLEHGCQCVSASSAPKIACNSIRTCITMLRTICNMREKTKTWIVESWMNCREKGWAEDDVVDGNSHNSASITIRHYFHTTTLCYISCECSARVSIQVSKLQVSWRSSCFPFWSASSIEKVNYISASKPIAVKISHLVDSVYYSSVIIVIYCYVLLSFALFICILCVRLHMKWNWHRMHLCCHDKPTNARMQWKNVFYHLLSYSNNYTSSSTTYGVFDIDVVVHCNNYIRIADSSNVPSVCVRDEWKPNGSTSSRTMWSVRLFSCLNYSISFAYMCSQRWPSVFYRIQ